MRIGFFTALFLIFLILKLTDSIDWSWWWVFSPMWIALIIAGLIAIIGAIAFVIKDAK